MTQNQLIDLLESEHLKALIERAEERGGHLEAAELETFAVEHDLSEDEAELLQRELEAHSIEIVQPDAESEKEIAEQAQYAAEAVSAPPTASSSSSPTSVATSCSRQPKRSRSRSASSAATRSPSA